MWPIPDPLTGRIMVKLRVRFFLTEYFFYIWPAPDYAVPIEPISIGTV